MVLIRLNEKRIRVSRKAYFHPKSKFSNPSLVVIESCHKTSQSQGVGFQLSEII